MLAVPIVCAPPVLSPAAWAAARGRGLVDVSSPAALRAHLGRSAVALGRLALGGAKVVVGPLVLGLLTMAAFADAVIQSWRLWLWVLQLPLLLYLLMSGLADVAIAFAALLGVTLPEEFDAPWRVTGPIALWHRTNRSLAGAFRRLVYLPLGGSHAHAGRNVVALFVAGGAWWLAWLVAFAGLYFYPPQAWVWPASSALLLAAGVLVARRCGAMPNAVLGFVATYCFVAVAVVPLFVPGWASPSAVGGMLLRLALLR
jgi:D-alanyl-lipoteichoic acid acyltransferase DltB (MBOAT superfamily)